MVSPLIVRLSLALSFVSAGATSAAEWSCGGPELAAGQGGASVADVQQSKGVPDALRRPVTEHELLGLIAMLKAIRPGGEGAGLAGGVGTIDDPRVGVVVGDLIALLGDLHARDLAGEIDRGALTPAGLKRVEGMLATMSRCARVRFEGRGGELVYQQTLDLVRKHRTALEPLLIEGLRFPSAPVPRRAGQREKR
jgi:hypothetical protein